MNFVVADERGSRVLTERSSKRPMTPRLASRRKVGAVDGQNLPPHHWPPRWRERGEYGRLRDVIVNEARRGRGAARSAERDGDAYSRGRQRRRATPEAPRRLERGTATLAIEVAREPGEGGKVGATHGQHGTTEVRTKLRREATERRQRCVVVKGEARASAAEVGTAVVRRAQKRVDRSRRECGHRACDRRGAEKASRRLVVPL